jgi:Tfp pilus assembly protein PilZ
VNGSKLRKDARTLVSLVARYRSPSTFEFVEEECYDLSTGGMFVKSQAPVAAGTLLKFECEAGERGKIRGVARVVWLRHTESEHGPVGMGVKFVKLDAGGRKLIESLVAQLHDHGHVAPSMSVPPEARVAAAAAETATSSTATGPEPAATQDTKDTQDTQDTKDTPSLRPPPSSRPPAAVASASASVAHAPAKPPAGSQPDATHESDSTRERVSDVRALIASGTPSEREDTARAEVVIAPSGSVAPAAQARPSAAEPSPEKPQDVPLPTRSVPPPRGWWRPWAWTAAGVALFFGITSSEWFQGDGEHGASTDLPPMAASEPTKLGLSPLEADDLGERGKPQAEPTPTATAEPAEPAEPSPSLPAPVADEAPPSEPAPSAAQPSEPAPAPAAPERTPPAAPPAPAAATPEPGASPVARATLAAAAGDAQYVVEVITNPPGATVLVGERRLVSPGRVQLGAFPQRVRVAAEKPGFQALAIWLERTGFTASDGVLLRRMYLGLKPEEPAAVSGKPAATTAQASKPPAEVPAPAAATVAATPPPAPVPAKPEAKGTPLEVATECLARGDNTCVIETLDGKAKTPRELELLIETFRAVGRTRDAHEQMAKYLERYPDERRSLSYRRTLELQSGATDKPAVEAPTTPESAPAPAAP